MINCHYFLSGILSRPIFLTLTCIFLLFSLFIYFALRQKSLANIYVNIAFILVWAGSLGNLYYRIFDLCVPDPIDFFGVLHFNWFDVLITTGIFVIIKNILYKI